MALYIKVPHGRPVMRDFNIRTNIYLQLFFFMKSIISLM